MPLSDIAFLQKLNNQKPIHPPVNRISEYISDKRLMPPNSPCPGFYDPNYTPYMIEIMDCLSPTSPIRHVSLMKGVQIGATTGILENTIGFYIGAYPADILFVSATQDNLKKWAMKKLEPLIDSCQLRDLIHAQIDNVKSRRSGDMALMKEFLGGSLLMASAQSPSALRQDSIRILLRDEVDGAPILLRTGEGNWLDVSEARTYAFGNRAKIADVSTPTEYETSNIRRLFEDGDQRKYFVPCPYCGEYQELQWGNENTKYGIKVDTQAGEIVRVYYSCGECGEAIDNSSKTYMLSKGRWEPTAKAKSKYRRSYHISALYSPIGMFSWSAAYQKYLEAQEDPINGMKSFTNLALGLPYKEEGEIIKPKSISRGTYKRGIVPDGVLFLTAGIDVQQGVKKDRKKPARLEMEICGHGLGYRTWSIDYKIIKGDVSDPFEGAWKKLKNLFASEEMTFRRIDGLEIPLVLVLVDSRFETDAVLKFCQLGARRIFAAQGFQYLVQRKREIKGEGIYEDMTPGGQKRWRWYKSGETGFYQFSGVFYKNVIFKCLRKPRQELPPQLPGFCEFPDGYHEKYYAQLTSEKRCEGGTRFRLIGGRTNEALDCRVLNILAQDLYIDEQIKLQREFAIKEQKLTVVQTKASIDAKVVLERMQIALDARIKQIRERIKVDE